MDRMIAVVALRVCLVSMMVMPLVSPVYAGQSVPWKQGGGSRGRRLSDVLKLYELGPSRFAEVAQKTQLSPADTKLIHQLLYRLPGVSPGVVEPSANKWPDAASWEESPESYCGKVFHVQGEIIAIQKHTLPQAVRDAYQFTTYYEIDIKTDKRQISILSRQVPATFRRVSPLGEHVETHALFVKTLGKSKRLFVAGRIRWLPVKTSTHLPVTKDMVALAKAGFDVSWLEMLRGRNRTRGIGRGERECFYQLLDAVSRNGGELRAIAGEPNLADILKKPRQQQGRILNYEGNLRRVTKIVVNDPDVRDRFGIQHYYQLEVFVSLGKRTIRLGKGKDAPVIRNQFPFTFCVTTLPEGLQQLARDSDSDAALTLNESVRVTGVLFKLWTFDSAFMSKFAKRRKDGSTPTQVGPLVLGTSVIHLKRPPANNAQTAWIIASAGAIVLMVIAFVLWRTSQRDKEVDQAMNQKRFELDRPEDLDDLQG